MSRMKWEPAPDVELRISRIVPGLDMPYVDAQRVKCIRSHGSKSRAIARIWEFPRALQVGLRMEPHYVIEVVSEEFDKLSEDEKTKTLIHELLHIPKSFSGAIQKHRAVHFDGRGGHKVFRLDRGMVDRLFRQLTG
jgi:predicted metallopeptidase